MHALPSVYLAIQGTEDEDGNQHEEPSQSNHQDLKDPQENQEVPGASVAELIVISTLNK